MVPLGDTVVRTIGFSKGTSGTTTTETYTLTDANGSAKVYTITWNNVAAKSPETPPKDITVQMILIQPASLTAPYPHLEKLIDFGLSGSRPTKTGTLLGHFVTGPNGSGQ